MRKIVNINERKAFVKHMNNCIDNNLVTNIDYIMQFFDKDLKLFSKDGVLLADNNVTRRRLTVLHVYNDDHDTDVVYVLSNVANRWTVESVLEVSTVYRSVVTRTFEYQVATVLYKQAV